MRNRVRPTTNDPVSLYGFCLAPDALAELTGASGEGRPATDNAEAGIDYTRFGRMIRRNRDRVG